MRWLNFSTEPPLKKCISSEMHWAFFTKLLFKENDFKRSLLVLEWAETPSFYLLFYLSNKGNWIIFIYIFIYITIIKLLIFDNEGLLGNQSLLGNHD